MDKIIKSKNISFPKTLVNYIMIVDDSWARASVWPPTIMHYLWLSSTIIQFELVQILYDSRW